MKRSIFNRLKKFLLAGISVPIFFIISASAADIIKIMPLGDSITNGTQSTHFSGYRGPLWTKLSTDGGYNINFVGDLQTGSEYQVIDPTFIVDHEGHDFYTTVQIANDVDSYLTSNATDIILLHIGTNDVKDLTSSSDPVIDQTVAKVSDILDNIDTYSLDIKVIVARIINHSTSDPTSKRNTTTSFNSKLETMLQNRIASGDNIEIVDMENDAGIDYTETTGDMFDRLHPNDSGYDKMANLWYEKLKTIIPIHKWKLDETIAPYIDNFRDADGTCTTGCPTAITGIIDGAQTFTDAAIGGIDVTDVSTFNWAANESFTIEFWMKSNSRGATQPDNDQNNAILMGREDAAGNLLWFIGTDRNTGNTLFYSDGVMTTGTTDIADDSWHHVVCVRDTANNQNRIYIDGQLQSQSPVTNIDLNGGTNPVNIGHLAWDGGNINNSYEYNGLLDEVTVYGGALDANQVLRDFNIGIDTINPVITLTGANPQTITIGTNYTELGATAIDDVDGDISANIIIDASAVDTATLGQYTVTYNVTDSAGNAATEVTRTVNVVDGTVPIITLLGTTPIDIAQGSVYTDAGATALDDVDGDITANIVTVSNVDTATLGQYTVTYNVTDTEGNAATEVIRTVNVVDPTVPDDIIPNSSSGGGCTYNPNSKNFDMTFLLIISLGLFYPFRRKFIKQSAL